MGEGLVTPGGHSIREEDAVLKYDKNGNPYWGNPQKIALDEYQENLPPADVFRAALTSSSAQEKDDKAKKAKKGKGKDVTPNPFRG